MKKTGPILETSIAKFGRLKYLKYQRDMKHFSRQCVSGFRSLGMWSPIRFLSSLPSSYTSSILVLFICILAYLPCFAYDIFNLIFFPLLSTFPPPLFLKIVLPSTCPYKAFAFRTIDSYWFPHTRGSELPPPHPCNSFFLSHQFSLICSED